MKRLGQQLLPLGGHQETRGNDNENNIGNFKAILESFGEFNSTLKDVMAQVNEKEKSGTKDRATYMSNTIQNQLLETIGEKIVEQISQQVKESNMYVVIADETTLHNVPYLATNVRYFNKRSQKTVEEFLSF